MVTWELWIPIAQGVVLVLVIPSVRSLASTVIALRDATRDLTTAVREMTKQVDDHEVRIRVMEGERRRRIPRASDQDAH